MADQQERVLKTRCHRCGEPEPWDGLRCGYCGVHHDRRVRKVRGTRRRFVDEQQIASRR